MWVCMVGCGADFFFFSFLFSKFFFAIAACFVCGWGG